VDFPLLAQVFRIRGLEPEALADFTVASASTWFIRNPKRKRGTTTQSLAYASGCDSGQKPDARASGSNALAKSGSRL
jgi:hypothetical protein